MGQRTIFELAARRLQYVDLTGEVGMVTEQARVAIKREAGAEPVAESEALGVDEPPQPRCRWCSLSLDGFSPASRAEHVDHCREVLCPVCGASLEALSVAQRGLHVDCCLVGETPQVPQVPPVSQVSQAPQAPKAPRKRQKQVATLAASTAAAVKRPRATGSGPARAAPKGATPARPAPKAAGRADKAPPAYINTSLIKEIAAEDKVIKPPATISRRASTRRAIPEVKVLTFSTGASVYRVLVDAFSFAAHSEILQYFLTHFHGDHYGGISKNWCYQRVFAGDTIDEAGYRPIVYCTEITAKLLTLRFSIDRRFLEPLALNVTYCVRRYDCPQKHQKTTVVDAVAAAECPGLYVTPITANHCPGAAIFLFMSVPMGPKRERGSGEEEPGEEESEEEPEEEPSVKREPGSERSGLESPGLKREPGSTSPLVAPGVVLRTGAPSYYLHCGDFRVNRDILHHPMLTPFHCDTPGPSLDKLYLDTTYMDPAYNFPKQEVVCDAAARMMAELVGPDPAAGKSLFASWFGAHTQTRITDFVAGRTAKRKLLVLVGTYLIGKENLAIAILRQLGGCPIYVSNINSRNDKLQILRTYGDEYLDLVLVKEDVPRAGAGAGAGPQSLATGAFGVSEPAASPGGAGASADACVIHLVPMHIVGLVGELSKYFNHNHYFHHYERCIGLRPTGWTFSKGGSERGVDAGTPGITIPDLLLVMKTQPRFNFRDHILPQAPPRAGRDPLYRVYTLPYSEHSLFRELSYILVMLRARHIIPTVNIERAQSVEKMEDIIRTWRAAQRLRAARPAEFAVSLGDF